MRRLFRVLPILLVVFMFQTPLLRIAQTTRHLLYSTSAFASRTMSSASASTSTSPATPSGLIAKSGIELLTWGTPNGHKASILLEELKLAYGTPYVFQGIDISKNVQKEAWYTAISPNGRIPSIVDHDRGDFAVFEGLAILSYLTRHYDPEYRFSFEDEDDKSRVEQWMSWQHGGVGPMQGQANHFYRLAKERIPYPTQRYVGETERLYGVLDRRLADRDYIVGPGKGKYSIADIANYTWINISYFSGVDITSFPNLHKWWERISERPAVKKGVAIPSESRFINSAYQMRLKEEPGFKEQEEGLKALVEKAKEQYNYKYSSP